MKNNNKGFSYIEMILVLGIMMLVVSFVSITIGLVNRNNVTKAGDKLASKISEARMMTIAKGINKGAAIITYENGIYYCTLDGEKYKVGSKPVAIYIICDDDSTLSVADLGSVEIKFDRNTGGLNSSNSQYKTLKLVNESNGKSVNYRFQKISGKLLLSQD